MKIGQLLHALTVLSTEAAYFNADWERRMLQDLERSNIAVLSIWSYNWWKNAKEEAERLSGEIKAISSAFNK